MKSPWQLGLLALALTSVSTYDYFFFRNRTQPVTEQRVTYQSAAESAASLRDSRAFGNSDSAPPISMEGLNRLSLESYKPHQDSKELAESQWPARDPFSTRRTTPIILPTTTPVPVKDKGEQQAAPAEPQCVFSGALIQEGSRLALVDGVPLSIGARLGDWHLVSIETDYIILEAGKEIRQIALKGATPEVATRKDTL